MKKRLQTLYLLLLLPLISFASALPQDTTKSRKGDPFNFKIYGFVRNDFTYDSRLTLASVDELFNFIPYDRDYNDMGEDMNAIPSSRFVSITSRLGFDVASPMYGNFQIKAKIEADFCGQANMITLFRIRQAHVDLRWPSFRILVGQSWHPMSSELLPDIVSLNTGAPFGPFSRAPQLRIDGTIGHVSLTAAAVYQFQYTSPGPEGNSMEYQKYSIVPEIYAGIQGSWDSWKIGFGAEYMQIKPRNELYEIKTNKKVHSFATQLFAHYHTKHFNAKAKSVYGQNLGHLLMMSGYGEYKYNDLARNDINIKYYALTQSATWLTLSYNTANPVHNVNATIFGGYMKNLGTMHEINGNVYVRGFANIDQMFRISPSIKYSYRDLNIGLEYEYTGVYYGYNEDNMKVTDTHLIGNHRLYLICAYNFSHKFTSKRKK